MTQQGRPKAYIGTKIFSTRPMPMPIVSLKVGLSLPIVPITATENLSENYRNHGGVGAVREPPLRDKT